jgi:outer membrane lipoprotein-sorting protein
MQYGRTPLLLVVLALVTSGAAQETKKPDAKRILLDADAATRAVRAVSYDAEFHAEGSLSKSYPMVSAKVVARKPLPSIMPGLRIGNRSGPVRISGMFKSSNSVETPFEVITNGKEMFIIDPTRKTVHRGQVGFNRLHLWGVGRPLMIEFLVSNPFGDELKGRSAIHEGVEEAGGVSCDVIYVVYANKLESRWFFGREDHLPRRVERVNPDGNLVLTISNLNTKPSLDPATFRPDYPDEYTERRRIPVEVAPTVLEDYVGTYRINEWDVREVAVRNGQLFSRRSGSVWLELLPVSETTFYYVDTFSSLTFYKDENGKVTHHVLDHMFGNVEKAVKVDRE